MKILVIGGTSFAGRHFTQTALEAGHEVTVFNRGVTNAGLFGEVERVRGDRNEESDLAALSGRRFDATVDVCAYVPLQVEVLLKALSDGAGLYTFVSSISVYPETIAAGFDESSPTLEPSYSTTLSMEEYGKLKVGCELTAASLAERGFLSVRPGYIVGPYDPTGRFTYWVERVARAAGGRMLGGEAGQPMQVIDARDLARFMLGLVEAGTTGEFNATAPEPALSFDVCLRRIAAGLGVPEPEVTWGGAREDLPLTDAGEAWGLLQADLSKGRAHGLAWRPLEETVADTLAWVTTARKDGAYTGAPNVMSTETESALLG